MGTITEIGDRVLDNVERVIVGKHQEVRLALVALLCRGHVLIEDVPGVGKIPMPPSALRPFSVEVAEFFKIQNGKIRQVEGVQLALPYKSPTGW